MYGIVDYLVGLHYEIESRRFLNEMSENKVYGWYKQPVQQTLQMPANDHFDNDDSDDWLTDDALEKIEESALEFCAAL